MLLSLSFVRKVAVCFCWSLLLAVPATVFAQANYYATNGTEYALVGSLPGDQVFPDVAVTPSGGYVVWQDNITDGDGWGISAMQLNSTLSGAGSSFRVNQQGAGDQQNAHVALLKNGGAVFVWQGGKPSFQHIYMRFLTSTKAWMTTNDVMVNASTNNFQISPAVATLDNGDVVVVWASFNEAGSNSMQDVYGRIFSPTGQPVTGEFLVNQFISYNQRTPTVAALSNGGFVVAWISEQERSVAAPNSGPQPVSQLAYASVDVYARIYDDGGNAQDNEFLVNTDSNPCADPDLAAGSDGGFMITWDAHDLSNYTNSLDIYARPFDNTGTGGSVVRVNSYLYGDQYAPRVSSIGTDYLIVWTSLAQDGSGPGVYGQFLRGDGSLSSGEFRVNTTTINQQIQPVVASDGTNQFLTIWSSFTGAPYSFDLFAQRYMNVATVLQPMSAPFVYAPFALSKGVYQPELQVSWSPVLGISISNYEVYVDGAATPMAVTSSNVWTMTAANGLTTNSTHSFQVDYVTTDGRRSPLSPSASDKTWSGSAWQGAVPVEWMLAYYGYGQAWPSVNTPLAPDGPSLYQVFLSGGNPLDPSTWLRTTLSNTPQGLFLSWNPQPGFTYQVQVSTDLTSWSNLGAPRFASGDSDSIYVGKSSAGYYRIVLLRQ